MASKESRRARAIAAQQKAHDQWKIGAETYRALGALTDAEIARLDGWTVLTARRYLATVYGRLGQRVAWSEYRRLTFRADRRRSTFAPPSTS